MMRICLGNFVRKLHYDYVICGSGSCGLALANRIVQSKYLQNKRLLIIDKGNAIDTNVEHEFPNTKNRVLLTNPVSVELFKTIGIWDELKKCGTNPINRIEIWDEYEGILEFNQSNKDISLCYMIDNTILQAILYKKFSSYISKKSHSHRLKTYINNIKSYQDNDKRYLEINLSDGSIVTTDLLIGCDGASSRVRELAKIETWQHDYNMTDHVGTIKYSKNVNGNISFKKITHNGFVAFLTLGPGVCSLSWCVNNPFGQEISHMSNNEFLDELNRTMAKKCDIPPILNSGKSIFDKFVMGLKPGSHGGNIYNFNSRPIEIESIIAGSRLSYPLKLIFAKTFVKDNIILVGDAAHRINPITGQGLNLGFKDVIKLSKILENTHMLGYDNYYPKLLQQYNNSRRLDAAMHIGFGTATNYIFANDIKFVGLLRSLGLSAANAFPYKDLIINKSIG